MLSHLESIPALLTNTFNPSSLTIADTVFTNSGYDSTLDTSVKRLEMI